MKTAEGLGAWHNQYNTQPLEECVKRAKRARLDFVIVKYGDPTVERAYTAAGIPWATERYVYARQPEHAGNMLANAVDAGACFAVINAEEGEGGWGPGSWSGIAMRNLVDTFTNRHPNVSLYACLDTRGDRLSHPYQQVALERCDGIMPMVYCGAFRPSSPPGYISRAFHDSLDGKDFRGKPVFPVLQSYSWEWPKDSGEIRRVGPYGIGIQGRRASALYPGCSFYTIHHATDAEWDAVCALRPEPKPEPPPLPEDDPFVLLAASTKIIQELVFRIDVMKLAADGKWAELGAKVVEIMEDRSK